MLMITSEQMKIFNKTVYKSTNCLIKLKVTGQGHSCVIHKMYIEGNTPDCLLYFCVLIVNISSRDINMKLHNVLQIYIYITLLNMKQ